MKWLTWENIGVDRMACGWFIQRFIDPQAEFQFIPAGQKPIQDDVEPFDIPGVKYSHRRGHCTFVTFLKEHHLKDPILQQIGHIVDEALKRGCLIYDALYAELANSISST